MLPFQPSDGSEGTGSFVSDHLVGVVVRGQFRRRRPPLPFGNSSPAFLLHNGAVRVVVRQVERRGALLTAAAVCEE